MKTKFKRKKIVEELFENYAFRIMFDDPKLYDLKTVYISRNAIDKKSKNRLQMFKFSFNKHYTIIITSNQF